MLGFFAEVVKKWVRQGEIVKGRHTVCASVGTILQVFRDEVSFQEMEHARTIVLPSASRDQTNQPWPRSILMISPCTSQTIFSRR